MKLKDKAIITAAVTGAVHIPSISEYLPITPQQIIDQAVGAAEAGAAVVHIHGRRKEDGMPTGDPEVMMEIVEGIHKRSNVLISLTTGGAVGMTKEQRIQYLPQTKPELASCNAGSMNFSYTLVLAKVKELKYDWEKPLVENTYNVAFSNTFADLEYFIQTMQDNHVRPEFEVYDAGMLSNIKYLRDKGIIKGHLYFQFVLGVMGGMPTTIDNLLFLYHTARNLFGDDFTWSCGAGGKNQFGLMCTVLTLGGNVRVGLEDNLYLTKGVLSKSNAESVSHMVKLAALLGKTPATPEEAMHILEL